jgi:ketosteroid isomerase-like protein
LERLLADFDDDRRKNFFCLAVNLLELPDVKGVMAQLDAETKPDSPPKEKATVAVLLLREMADRRKIALELRKK